MAIHRALLARGVATSYAVTSGNEIALAMADYIRFLADDPESGRSPASSNRSSTPASSAPLANTRRRRQAGGRGQRSAAPRQPQGPLAHTGALAGALECFDAVAETIGVVRVDTLDEVVETVEYFCMRRPPRGRGSARSPFPAASRA